MKKIKTEHYFSQPQETEIMLPKLTNKSIKNKLVLFPLKSVGHTNFDSICKTPVKNVTLLPGYSQIEIGPSPLSSRYNTFLKFINSPSNNKLYAFSSIKKLNF